SIRNAQPSGGVSMLLQRLNFGAAVFLAFALACSDDDSSRITAQRSPSASVAASSSADPRHAMDHNDQIKWGPAPPIFPPGAQFAVVQGDPSVAGQIFTVRVAFTNAYVLA